MRSYIQLCDVIFDSGVSIITLMSSKAKILLLRKRSKEFEVSCGEGMTATNTRILELRKEKSRDAARSRRGKENYEFYELAKMLPLPAAITSQLDKASIIRLSISYLKLRDFSSHGDPAWNHDRVKTVKSGPNRRRSSMSLAMELFEAHEGNHILQTLDGFAFALSNDGRFLYISETVSIYLGLSQVEMAGSSIFDYVHQRDHNELADQLGIGIPQPGSLSAPGSPSDDGSSGETPRAITPPLSNKPSVMHSGAAKPMMSCSLCIRMKSTLTKRGVHVKTSGYRVVHILGRSRSQPSFSASRKSPASSLGIVAIAVALPNPTISEWRIESDMFVMRLSLEFKILYCEARICQLMDLSAEDVTNHLLYNHCHAADLNKVRQAHVDLMSKGQVVTDYYRLMNKHGGYVWVQTVATVLYSSKDPDEMNMVAVTYVLSGIEYGNIVMDNGQLGDSNICPAPSDVAEHAERIEEKGKKTVEKRRAKRLREMADDDHHANTDGDGCKTFDSDAINTSRICLAREQLTKQMPSEDDITETDKRRRIETDCNDRDVTMIEKTVTCRLDYKNSRRKMDKPRKRCRDTAGGNYCDSHTSDHAVSLESMLEMNSDDMSQARSPSRGNMSSLNNTVNRSPHSPSSPASVQDLNTKSPLPLTASPSSHTSHELSEIENPLEMNAQQKTPHKQHQLLQVDEDATTASVKDLEEAMNRHLPMIPQEFTSAGHTSSTGSRTPVTSSFLERNQSNNCLHNQKTAIQWASSQTSSSHQSGERQSSVASSNTTALPASRMLRNLYANRESVIRTNVYNTRPHYGYHSAEAVVSANTSLLTPPGIGGLSGTGLAEASDPPHHHQHSVKISTAGSSNRVNDISETQLAHHHSSVIPMPFTHQSTITPTTPLLHAHFSSYPSTPISLTLSGNPGTESYNITPPSSVSPQDKFLSVYSVEGGTPISNRDYSDGIVALSASASSPHCTNSQSSNQHLATSHRIPLKPQIYSMPLPAHMPYDLSSAGSGSSTSFYQNMTSSYGQHSCFNHPVNMATAASPWYASAQFSD